MKILCRLLLLAAALVIGGYLGDIFLSSSDFGSAGISIFAIACTFLVMRSTVLTRGCAHISKISQGL